ncbi:hypothetical protein FQN57_004472 [Myotisia sp. PD_48]|nr:hypothetical protein FQN57_004472 [Myotisia sp. PD_48]
MRDSSDIGRGLDPSPNVVDAYHPPLAPRSQDSVSSPSSADDVRGKNAGTARSSLPKGTKSSGLSFSLQGTKQNLFTVNIRSSRKYKGLDGAKNPARSPEFKTIMSKHKIPIVPHLKKSAQRESNSIDLSRSAVDNKGLAIYNNYVRDRAYGEPAGNPGIGAGGVYGQHRRSTSGVSQLSTSSTTRPGGQYVHPMRQTPRSYTPPLGRSNQNSATASMYSEGQGYLGEHEDLTQRNKEPRNRSSLNLNREPKGSIHFQAEPSPYQPVYPPTTIGTSSFSRVFDNGNGRDAISHIPRSSLEFPFRSKSRSSTTDPAARAAAVQAARQAFEEKEAAKLRKLEEQTLKAQDKELRRRERREQTGRPSLSDFTLRPPKFNEKSEKHDSHGGQRTGRNSAANKSFTDSADATSLYGGSRRPPGLNFRYLSKKYGRPEQPVERENVTEVCPRPRRDGVRLGWQARHLLQDVHRGQEGAGRDNGVHESVPSILSQIKLLTLLSVVPSKRAFQTQFKRWGFPSKQNPAHKNDQLVARIKQLWEANTTQPDMLQILLDEGFTIKERELMRVRAKNRWLLRVPNGMKSRMVRNTELSTPQKENDSLLDLQSGDPYTLQEHIQDGPEASPRPDVPTIRSSTEIPPEILARRRERLEKLRVESEARWATKRRRRRTKGWAGLPADPPGPPRFPSETTIDESKKYLNLDNTRYREIRDHFQRICENAGFSKKTIAGPERWQAAKDQLIHESLHLQTMFWGNPMQLEYKTLALDVVCTDVTKRMRSLKRRMTIADAKNALGINPEESRQLRNSFYDMLKADYFTSKLEAGDEHWRDLKDQWIQKSELLQHVLAQPVSDPDHPTKLKAIEVLCRDVMKRLRDDQAKRDFPRGNPNPDMMNAPPTELDAEKHLQPHDDLINTNNNTLPNHISTLASEALANAPIISSEIDGTQIDPSLLQAIKEPSAEDQSANQLNSTDPLEYVNTMLHNSSASIPVYIHVHPQSPSQFHEFGGPWLDKLSLRSLCELRDVIASRIKSINQILRVEGISTSEDGHQSSMVINDDHELDVYLTHMQGHPAVFVVLLQ